MHNKFLNHPKVDTESRMIADSELSVIELLLKKDLKLSEKKHQKTPRANYKLEREERKENQSQQTGQYVFRSQMDITRDKRKTQQAQLLERRYVVSE